MSGLHLVVSPVERPTSQHPTHVDVGGPLADTALCSYNVLAHRCRMARLPLERLTAVLPLLIMGPPAVQIDARRVSSRHHGIGVYFLLRAEDRRERLRLLAHLVVAS